MYTRLFVGWVLIPVFVAALHFGPGQRWLQRDDAAKLARAAVRASESADWEQAAVSYSAALVALPESADKSDQSVLEVALGRALVMSGNFPEGQERLEQTLRELTAAGHSESPISRSARFELATSGYYAAWIMRLEGATPEEWKPEAEVARQQFRLLAENAREVNATGDEGITFQRSLEATIRLEQMDLTELLARPLPKNCPQCKQNLCQRKRKQCAGRCRSEGKEKQAQEKDAREEIKKTNSAGLYSGDGIGS